MVDKRAAEAEAMAPGPTLGGGWGATLGLAWVGACCGLLAGIAVVGIVGLAAGWWAMNDSLHPMVLVVGGGGGVIGGAVLAFWLRRRSQAH